MKSPSGSEEFLGGFFSSFLGGMGREEGERGGRKSLTHEVKVDAVIYEVIHPRAYVFGRAEVDPVCLAYLLDLLVRACHAADRGVEFA